MGFGEAVSKCLKEYVTFSGRASRSARLRRRMKNGVNVGSR